LAGLKKTFPATAVCDLTKEHLDLFMAGRSHLAAKSKNHLRATVKMFLNWCIKKDYLPAKPPLAGCVWHEAAKSRQRRNRLLPPGGIAGHAGRGRRHHAPDHRAARIWRGFGCKRPSG
jgi:hypothetical protein